MKARAQEVDDDRTLVDEPESEGSVSEEESDGEAPLKAAPPAEQAWGSSDKRKKRKANSAPAAPSVESAFAKMHGPTPTHSLPPMPPASPFHAHQDFSPYGTTPPYGSPYSPPLMPMAMYPGYYGQTPYGLPPSPPPNSNVNSFNNSKIGTLNISNTNSYRRGKAATI